MQRPDDYAPSIRLQGTDSLDNVPRPWPGTPIVVPRVRACHEIDWHAPRFSPGPGPKLIPESESELPYPHPGLDGQALEALDALLDVPPELALRELPNLDILSVDRCTDFARRYGYPDRSHEPVLVEKLPGLLYPLRLVALDLVGEPAWSDPASYPPNRAWGEERRIELWTAHRIKRDGELTRVGQLAIHLDLSLSELSVALRPEPFVSLTCALALQLYNVIVENAPIHRCANDRCQRFFQRQSGRPRKGVTRSTGVLYCSRSCARNQADRERRRRLRDEKAEG